MALFIAIIGIGLLATQGFVARAASGEQWFVSHNGRSTGSGTSADPIDLATALSDQSPAGPGDTIWLRGGVYRGAFTSVLAGTAAAPIVVRQVPGERATLDGAGQPSNTLIIRGAHTWYWGFEVMNSDPVRMYTRRVNVDDPASLDRVRGTGIYVYGPQTKLINLVVHDALNGIFFAESAIDAEIHGVLTFHNGVLDTARGHGHGIYIQNRLGTKRIEDVVSFGNHATGMKVYAEAGWTQGVRFDGVVSFSNGVASLTGTPLDKMENLFVGGTDNPSDRIEVLSSFLYHAPQVLASNMTLGYQNKNNGSLVVRDTSIMGGAVALTTKHWRTLAISRNTLFATESANHNADQSLVQVLRPSGSAYHWNENEYHDGTAKALPFTFNSVVNKWGGGNLSITEWQQASGSDSNSSYRIGRPIGAVVHIRPNRYDNGRAHIIIYNWDRVPRVPVDISAAGIKPGDRFKILDAQNYFGAPVASGTYSGGVVTIPMTELTVANPVGGVRFDPEHAGPEFGVFVVVKDVGALPLPPPAAGTRVSAPTLLPSGGAFNGPVDVALSVSTASATIQYRIDHGAWLSYSGPFRLTATSILQARATKPGADDSVVSSGTFTISTQTPPNPGGSQGDLVKVRISSPREGQWASGHVTVRAIVLGAAAAEAVQFFVDGVPIGSSDTQAPFEVQWDTSKVLTGGHYLTAVARIGNQTATSRRSFVRIRNSR